MKKRVVGIFFALVLCLAMVPISAFAEQKTTIRTVDQLLQFAKAVDNGEYGPYLLGKLTNRCSAVGISPQPVGN